MYVLFFKFQINYPISELKKKKIHTHLFGKRTGHLNLYTLCSRDGWTYIYFIFTHTPPTNLYVIYLGVPLSSKQNTHAFTHSSLPLSLIMACRNFNIKFVLTLAVIKTQ